MKILKSLLWVLLLLPFSLASKAQEGELLMTIHTDAYVTSGADNSISIAFGAVEEGQWIDIDAGFGSEEFEVGVASLDGDGNVGGSLWAGKVSSEGIIKVYGDPTKIDYMNASGSSITTIEFHKDLNLQILNLEHNNLQSLDLDMLDNLQVLYIMDNPFTKETPFMLGRHDKLLVLEMAQIDHISPDFKLSNFPDLRSFDAYHCLSLTQVDPSQCPNLVRLSLEMTNVKTVDISKNSYLSILNVSESKVTSLDLSKNQNLSELYISHGSGTLNTEYKFSSIDVTKNPKLYYFFCGGNNLTELDLSGNPILFTLSAAKNKFRSIDFSKNPDLYSINLNGNLMDFATLPLPLETWSEYYYDQQDMPLDETYKVGDVIDLSSRVLRAGSSTAGYLYMAPQDDPTNPVKLDDSYYKYENGKVTLLQPVDGSAFLLFENSIFNEYPLYTTHFRVKSAEDFGKDDTLLKFSSNAPTGNAISMKLGVKGASAENPAKIKVDFGSNGENVKEFTITDEIPAAVNVTGNRDGYSDIVVYGTQDAKLTSLEMDGVSVSKIDLSTLTELRALTLKNAGLYDIDLSYNVALQRLDLSYNNLKSASLKGKTFYFYKSSLTDVNLSNNAISEFLFDDLYSVKHLNLAHNEMEELNLSTADNFISADFSFNKLSEISFDYCEQLQKVILSNNNLTQIYIPEAAPLNIYDIRNNRFTIADMPTVMATVPASSFCSYAPQKPMNIALKSPGVDLSGQNITVDGKTTEFVWKKADGTPLKLNDEYTIDGGQTKFLKPSVGPVYCEMTHAAYPQFAGENVFNTTLCTPIDMPTHEIASFVTPTGGEQVILSLAAQQEGGTVFFDWEGNGNVTQYTLGTTYTRFEAATKAGAKVRVLVADAADKLNIFSVTGATMRDLVLKEDLKACFALSIVDAGLTEFDVPVKFTSTGELNLSGNKLTSLDFSKFPNLIYISLNNNSFKEIDLSPLDGLQLAYIGNNKLSNVKLNNSQLWNLDLGNNQLESINLSNIPQMQQLWLNGNRLSSIDVSKMKNLRVLNLTANRFTFATLPQKQSTWNVYSYGKQANIDATPNSNVVDLSAEAMVGETPTTFRWFIDAPVYNDDSGEWEGEELIADEEYSIVNGVTTFNFSQSIDNIVCMLTNAALPNVTIFTKPMTISPSTGIKQIVDAPNSSVAIYTAGGALAANATIATLADAINSLPSGVYVVKTDSRTYKVVKK